MAVSRPRAALIALSALALAAWALIPTYPNYDSYFHLVWGREIAGGASPGFEAYAAPTEHPLWVLTAALASLAGEHGDRVLVLVTFLSHVALIAGVFAFARAVFDEATAWVGALLVGSSFALLLYASRAYVDVPFLALVLWAAAVEAGPRTRTSRTPMALLAVAGLLRPEAWVLSGALLAWRWRERARLDLLAIAAAAPLLWVLTDLVVTGDPIFSLSSTSELARALGRPRGIGHVPESFVSFLADTAREPVAAAGVVGMALAWRARRRLHRPELAYALFVAGAVTFVGTGIGGLSILPRYLTVPAVSLCIFAAFALTRDRRVLIAAIVAGLAFTAVKLGTVDRLTTELRYNRSIHRDLVSLLDDGAVRRALRCGPLSTPNYRLVPESRWHLDADSSAVVARSAPGADPETGVALVVAGQEKTIKRYGYADGAPRRTNRPPAGFAPLARRGSFVALVRCPAPQPRGG